MPLKLAPIAVVSAAVIALWAVSMNCARSDDNSRRCPVMISGFDQSITWRHSASRIRVQAKQACGPGINRPLRLEGVVLTLEKSGHPYARLESLRGLLSRNSNQFVLGQTIGPPEFGQLGANRVLVIDLAQGRIEPSDAAAFSLLDKR